MNSVLYKLFLLAFVFSSCQDPKVQEVLVSDLDQAEWMIGAASSAEEVHPLLPGMRAPSFEALQKDGSVFQFDPNSRKKGAIIIFYRGGWCPYCNRQLMELQSIDDELVEMGYELLFLSADSPARLSEGSLSDDVPFSLLSDAKMDVAKKFGVAFRVDDATIERYKKSGLDLAEEAGYGHYLLPAPSAFIVDPEGVIRFQYTNPDYRIRLNSELLITAARVSLTTL